MQAELRHEPVEDAEEARVVVEAVLHEVVETVGGKWRPLPLDRDDERALAGVEASRNESGARSVSCDGSFSFSTLP